MIQDRCEGKQFCTVQRNVSVVIPFRTSNLLPFGVQRHG